MEKTRFESYCDRLNRLKTSYADWYKQPGSLIADYLRESTEYGFGKVLVQLLGDAYKVIKEDVEKNGGNEDIDLYELASLLSVTVPIAEYRFSAYLFTVSVAAVCFFGLAIERVDVDNFDENELIKFDGTVPMQQEKDPIKKQLKKYSIRLLDFSRTNQLVHFKPIKSSTMSLFCGDTTATLRYILKSGSKVYLSSWKKLNPQVIYKCKICGRVEYGEYDYNSKKVQPAKKCPVCDENNAHNRKSMIPLREQLVCLPSSGYSCSCGCKASVDDIIKNKFSCEKCGKPIAINSYPIVSAADLKNYAVGEMVCSVGDIATNETAKTLLNKAKNMERNFGLHVLYLAYGFLKWCDINGTEYNSPILLCPINLSIDKTKGRYYFEIDQSAGNSFEVNKTLVHMLSSFSKTCSIELPEFDNTNTEAYLSIIKQSLKNVDENILQITKNWEVDASFGIGLFHYQKLQLQHDIETYQDKYLKHPIIRRLCGDDTAEIAATQTQQRHSMKFMMLDADSSQEEVIKASQEGKSFILQGPPGSGKSQTITNIISSALGEGKTVLFVTEKSSARSVITDNLSQFKIGADKKLTDFVLDFDSFKKRGGAVGRDPFIAELNRCLIEYNPTGAYDDGLLADEAFKHDQIEGFMTQMRGDYGGINYMRLLQEAVPYAPYLELRSINRIPSDRVSFAVLKDAISKYYSIADKCGCGLDYRKDSLYGCKGDEDSLLYKAASDYLDTCNAITEIVSKLKPYGFDVKIDSKTLNQCASTLRLWAKMPKVSNEILAWLNDKWKNNAYGKKLNGQDSLVIAENRQVVEGLIERAKWRKDFQKQLSEHSGNKIEPGINKVAFSSFALDAATNQAVKYKSVFRRLGKKYSSWCDGIFSCYNNGDKKGYKAALAALDELVLYKDYSQLKAENEQQAKQDKFFYGITPASADEWNELINKLEEIRHICLLNNYSLFNVPYATDWLKRFEGDKHEEFTKELLSWASKIDDVVNNEQSLASVLTSYSTEAKGIGVYPTYKRWAEIISNNADRLSDWHRMYLTVSDINNNKWLPILIELIDENENVCEKALQRLNKTYYQKIIKEFVVNNKLNYINSFNRYEHVRLIDNYADIDLKVLGSGAKRLYESLSLNLKNSAKTVNGKYQKLQSKTHYSIKQTIAENWDYIKYIKPCFMMSPLNVSQYVDIDVCFDLVIFDEASQIFTEDALASIVRGKQVIIAGDSKQLPPCDFFRAGEVIQDDDEQYYDEEVNHDLSLLTNADEALNDASIALTWHYRSCDEALIAFANKEMDYNLISFPSATKNENDGIRYVKVPYSSTNCYIAGKGGSHINPGEADKIIELIYSEMTNPDRENFSIGVVAFSNAQAFEIESRWEVYKQHADKKDNIERWEKLHENEPLIFCNLDTVQGDERDTIIISICYSQDANGKFILPYLGRIRLPSGKKRINVAVTRARHQMLVVSTLESYQLKNAMLLSSAPEENKEGAKMLYNFMEYASQVDNREVVSSETENQIVRSVCQVLDEEGIEYKTEIGRSECKIDIGIYSSGVNDSFKLGVIIDNPNRTDFDSVREYSRLTEQVLCKKYGWTIYRVYPIAWMNDFDNEKKLLLDAIHQASNA